MKASTLKRLTEIATRLAAFRDEIDDIVAEEQEAFDGKSERWQESEKGQESQALINSLESASTDIDSAVTNFEEIEGVTVEN